MSPNISFVSCGPKNALEGTLSTLIAQERAHAVRGFGVVLEVCLEALRRVKGVNTKICKNKEYPERIVNGKAVRDTATAEQVHQSARQTHHTYERMIRKSLRECRTVTHAVETLVNPIEDGTGSWITATLQSLES